MLVILICVDIAYIFLLFFMVYVFRMSFILSSKMLQAHNIGAFDAQFYHRRYIDRQSA